MKKFTCCLAPIILVMTFSCTVTAQMGTGKWSFSNPRPFGFTGNAISYGDDNTALVVGEAGGIARTTDGGGTWAYMCYTVPLDGEIVKPIFNDVHFVNSSLAYAAGNNGILIKTTDGGFNWTGLNNPFAAGRMEINTVWFTDANTGYIAGDGDLNTRQSTLYKTTDGGATWQAEYTFPAPAIEWLSAAIYKVRFNTNGVGYVGGSNGLVWKYANGVWSDYSITPATIFPNVNAEDSVFFPNWEGGTDTIISTYNDNIFGLDQQNYRAIAIISDTEVVVGTQNNGGLIRINTAAAAGTFLLLNNGSALSQKYAPVGSPQIYNLCTRNGNTIAGASSTGEILMSNDRGFTWQSRNVYTPGSQEAAFSFFGVDISPANRFGLCGMGGVIADSVSSWRKPYVNVRQSQGFSGYGIESISFADALNGVAAGGGGAMFRTDDGGNTWEDITNPTFNPWDYYTTVEYLSPSVLIASASNGLILRSFDRGTSFDLLFAEESNGNLSAMDFINEDSGWVVSNNMYTDQDTWVSTFHQVIYRTTDGGLSWDSSATSFPFTEDYAQNNYLYDIKFLNRNTGYAVGANATIYKSTDGGVNWVKLTNIPATESAKIIKSISIVDENVVFVSGDEGLVMKTTNGGSSWQLCNNGLPGGFSRFEKILMIDAGQGTTFANGNVYTTLDGGNTWSVYYAPISDNFKGACYVPITGCSSPVCKKVFAGGFFRGNIMKFDADVVLPVKFSELTGRNTAEGNRLFWTALAQENVQWFQVERSVTGVDFVKAGDQLYPSALLSQSYQWLDEEAAAGKIYYRVKAVEKSGAVYYTNIVVINTAKPVKWQINIINHSVQLSNALAQKGLVTASVINTAGQVLLSQSWNHGGGAFSRWLQLPASSKGVYMIKVSNGSTETVSRVFVQ